MSLTQQLTEILNDLQAVKAETSLILGAIVLLILGLIHKSELGLKVMFATVIALAYYFNSMPIEGRLLSNALDATPLAQKFTNLFLITAIALTLYRRDKKHASEFYFFILSLLIGSLVMMKANSLLIIYLSIELASFASYILTNFTFKKQGHEAGIKYLLFGAISSAIMLFGLGIIYGTTQTFFIHEWTSVGFTELLPQVGLMMLFLGLFFKISIVPLHIWVPATYQSAPNDATAFMSIVPKLAALVLLFRVVQTILPEWIASLSLALGMLTIVFGTLGALRQSNVRRMISFGAIAHSGFLLPFVFMNSDTAMESFWWYSCVYATMNLGIFFLVDNYEKKGITLIDDYKAASKEVWLGVSMTVILVSLVGLPPFAGFTAKLFLFSSLWEYYLNSSNGLYVVYLLIAVLASVVSLFFYLKVPRSLFLSGVENSSSTGFSLSTKIIATLFTILLLLLFFAPQILQ